MPKTSTPGPAGTTGASRSGGGSQGDLDTEVRFVKGVGAAMAGVLSKLGIITVRDLLQHYPARYEDRTQLARVSRLQDGQRVTLRLRVSDVESQRAGRRMINITRVAAEDDSGTVVLVWFNQHWMRDRFLKLRGREIIVYGQVRYGRMGFEINSPDWEVLSEDDSDPWSYGKFVPVYPLTEGLTQGRMRRIVRNAIEKYAGLLKENIPTPVLDELDLMDVVSATRGVHWSESEAENAAARKRLVFEEFLYLQLALAQMRHEEGAAAPGIAFKAPPGLLDEIRSTVSFQLTGAQTRVIGEIWDDMARPHPMNRMLQGDVGSGKTLVAVAAMALAARNGYQSAMMAPTEVLAEQHYFSISPLAEPLGLTVELLSGSMRAKAKQAVYERLREGCIDVAVGTHALLQDVVEFHKLGLVVVDEQHKFGVKQRGTLRGKGDAPDMLVMTATPIPRTLTMTVYGDLDISVIDEMPAGRRPVKTHHRDLSRRTEVYEGVRTLLRKGGQAFVVCPLVSESEKLQTKAATELAGELQTEVFPEYKVGLLHGQMKSDEKQASIAAFRAGECQILVCTTVVEVGVDIPSANVIVVENAERYGLAQLHQLRGRVGRSGIQSFCVLLSDAATDESAKRMDALLGTNNGFAIAERDLEIRGPGEFFGVRQSGLPSFKIADILRDGPMLELSRRKAMEIVEKDPKLLSAENRRMGRVVEEKYRRQLLETVA